MIVWERKIGSQKWREYGRSQKTLNAILREALMALKHIVKKKLQKTLDSDYLFLAKFSQQKDHYTMNV